LAITYCAYVTFVAYTAPGVTNRAYSIGNYIPTERAVTLQPLNGDVDFLAQSGRKAILVHPVLNYSTIVSMGSLRASLGRAHLENINYKATTDDFHDKLEILWPRWHYLIMALAGWYLLGWGWWNMRGHLRLHWSVWIFLIGSVVWASGFTLFLNSF